MPVVGHAFVGIATAWSVPPKKGTPAADPGPGSWLSALVVLAYLPDIVGHGSGLLGLGDWRAVSHSVLFALIATAVLAPVLAVGFKVGPWRAAAIVFGSLLGHDLLDLLQGSDRVLGWPFLDRSVRLRLTVIPENAIGEALVFSVAFLVFLAARSRHDAAPPFGWWRTWRGGAVAGLILIAAVTTHAAKTIRDREVRTVEDLLGRHQYAEALGRLDRLRLWPTMRRSAEVERLTARALWGRGDRAGAEERLLAAERAEPDDYRTVVDLAMFYASSSETTAERRRRVAPYQARLEQEFARRRDLRRVLARVEQRLTEPAPPQAQ